MDVTMPDGTVITDVPEGTTQSQLLQMYGRKTAKEKIASKFTPDEDTTYSPEGMPLVTPTSAAEPTGAGKVAQQVMTDVVGAPVRAAMSLAKPVANVMNMAGYGAPKQAIQQIDTGIKQQGPDLPLGSLPIVGDISLKGPMGSVASFGGDIYSANKILGGLAKLGAPISSAVPAVAPIISNIAKSPIKQTVLGGGVLGGLEAESGAPLDIAKGVATGAALGAGVHAGLAGLGKVLSPQLERLKQAENLGLNVPEFIKNSSVGQFFGGFPQKVENFFGDIPFTGALSNMEAGTKAITQQGKDLKSQLDTQVKTANAGLSEANKTAAIEKAATLKNQGAEMDQRLATHIENLGANIEKKYSTFSTDMINKSLEPIGAKLDSGVKGTDAIKFAQDKVEAAYDAAIPKIGDVRVGDPQVKALQNIVEQNKRKLGGENSEYYNKFAGDVEDIISKIGDSKLISAREWHNIFKDLGGQAYKNKGFGVKGTQAEYGSALTQLKNAWMDIIENTPGAALIKQANQSHSALQVPQTAAGYLKTYTEKGGQFDPKEFLRALKNEASRKKFSAGEARLQDEALATFEQMAKDKAILKAQEDNFKQQLAAKKAEQKAEMKAGNRTAATNLANQKAYLEMMSNKQKKPEIDKFVEDVKNLPHGSYAAKRLGYSLAGLGGAGTTGHFLANYLGIPVEQQLQGTGALLAGTNILHSKFIQDLIKKGAVADRPELVRKTGTALQNIASPTALGTVQNLKSSSPNDNNQNNSLPVPQKTGGLVSLKKK
jgi:hypothetical protein